jgi:hypothetical protein
MTVMQVAATPMHPRYTRLDALFAQDFQPRTSSGIYDFALCPEAALGGLHSDGLYGIERRSVAFTVPQSSNRCRPIPNLLT